MNQNAKLDFKAFFYTISTIMQALIRLFFYIISADILGPIEYSSWSLIQAIMTYSVLIGFGAMPALGRELPILQGQNKIKKYNEMKNNSLKYFSYYWVLFIFISLLLYLFNYENRFFSYGIILAVLQSCIQYYTKIHRSTFNFIRLSLGLILASVWLIVSCFIIPLYPSHDFLFILFSISLFINFIVLLNINDIRNIIFNNTIILKISIIKKLHTIGLPLLFSGFFISLLYSLDRWFINFSYSKYILGQYSIAVFCFMGARLLISSLGQIYLPTIAFGYGKNKSLSKEKKHLLSFIVISSFLIFTFVLSVWFIAPIFVHIYFEKFTFGLEIAQWSILGLLLMPFATLCSIILQVKKMLWHLFWGQLIGLLLVVIILYIGNQYNSIIILGKFISISYVAFSLCVILTTVLSNKRILKI